MNNSKAMNSKYSKKSAICCSLHGRDGEEEMLFPSIAKKRQKQISEAPLSPTRGCTLLYQCYPESICSQDNPMSVSILNRMTSNW